MTEPSCYRSGGACDDGTCPCAQRSLRGERIISVAVRRKEKYKGDVPTTEEDVWMTYMRPAPARHHHVLHWMPGETLAVEQGFLTSTGRFVGRKEAMGIALAAGQVPTTILLKQTDLFSEDLW